MGKTKEQVWELFAKYARQLDQLQHKGETITSEAPLDPEVVSPAYWRQVADNLLDLATHLEDWTKVRATITTLTQ